MRQTEIERLIDHYVTDTLTATEYAVLMDYFSNVDNHAQAAELMRKYWEAPSVLPHMSGDKAEMIFNKVVAAEKKAPVRIFVPWMKWAAAILLFFSIGLLWSTWQEREQSLPEKVTSFSGSQHTKISLPDGSTVILNKESKLNYPLTFEGKTREVFLDGEGYFDIKHDSKHPFIVHSGDVKTTILGTAFNIKALSGQPVIVTVTRGKVSVSNQHQLLGVLEPNQQLVYQPTIKKSEKIKVAAQQAIAWQENDLFFEDVTMADAMAMLSKKYKVAITFENDLGKNCRFSATFLQAQGLEEILKVITSFNGASYIQLAGTITIKAKDCE